jgi:hypothetical protein
MADQADRYRELPSDPKPLRAWLAAQRRARAAQQAPDKPETALPEDWLEDPE